MKFKKGDKVRCIDAGNHEKIKNNKVYTVEGPGFELRNSDDKLIQLKEVTDGLGFFDYRFELVKKEFCITKATDQELANEYRKTLETVHELGKAIRERGFVITYPNGTVLPPPKSIERIIRKEIREVIEL